MRFQSWEGAMGWCDTLIKTLTECTKKPFVGMTCQMNEESVFVYVSSVFFKKSLMDQLQGHKEASSTLI